MPEEIYNVTQIVDGKIVTEEVVKEGAGYSTTLREKTVNDEKQERNLKILEEAFLETIKGMDLSKLQAR